MRTLPRLAALLLGCSLLAAPSPSVGGGADDGTRLSTERRVPQTSDGVRGEIGRPIPGYLRGVARSTAPAAEWRVAPGIRYHRWDQVDARGPIRAHLLTVNLRTRGVSLGYGSPGFVARTDEVSDIVARGGGIAGVNGDFFDIGDTGAPLGIGRSPGGGLLHAPRAGWNSAFFLDSRGRPDIGPLEPVLRVAHRPGMRITNYNSPVVPPGGIGAYTPRWGLTSGYSVTDGRRRGVRYVRVVRKRVVETGRRLSSGKRVRGIILVGRGAGARKLMELRKGDGVRLQRGIVGSPRLAITGNKILVSDGVIDVVDDREMHPRTAIGYDRDTGDVLLLVVDGRQSFSRGYTMVELAELMIELGADEALNLDGGGSSTMVAPKPGEGVRVLNSPSDGAQRKVANGLTVRYRRPR
ncbi:phosphodiester glycosidase family protein [Nocardioides sp. 503]|uniref:phosphodiester glycosidase family protein n=1 Tax=Nocardioides sp. 503 TaxID=2508326 RepID=UPI00106F21C8|nr:phosphodiester glycosidase family protein [Nocardioides sp. 503]